MSRPTGAPWGGETWSMGNGNLLSAGTAQRWDNVAEEFNADNPTEACVSRSENPNLASHDNDFCRAYTGFEGFWYASYWTTYLNWPDDVGLVINAAWRIRCRGTGTMEVWDELDTGYAFAFPDNLVDDDVDVDLDDGWMNILVPTSTFSTTDLANGSNHLLGIKVVSGTVDIDCVNLQLTPLVPPDEGREVIGGSYDFDQVPTIDSVSVSSHPEAPVQVNYWPSSGYVPAADAFDAMQTALNSGTSVEKTYPLDENAGFGLARNEVGTFYDTSAANWQYVNQLQYMSVWVDMFGFEPAYNTGTEGLDYARYPDRGDEDWDAYWKWAGTARPGVVDWINDEIHVGHNGSYTASGTEVSFEIVTGVQPGTYYDWFDTRIVVPPAVTGTTYTIDADFEVEEDFISGILPYEFEFYVICGNSATGTPFDVSGWPGTLGSGPGAGIAVQLGVEDGDLLTATVNVPQFKYYNPSALPIAGRLKLRMTDSTWRILGNEADTGGRLKIQTPDLTWWQEYRTTDGDVPVHPLKLYTADGWVVVARMTPD